MRAIVYEGGGVEALEVREAPDPKPGPGEALVRVRACAMNHLDVWASGSATPPRGPRILGADIAGEVAALGPGTTGVALGDRVLVYPGIGCGHCRFCQRGDHADCRRYRLFGMPGLDGGYAELMSTDAANLVPLPESISYEDGASIPLVFITAWRMVLEKARVEPGEWVLVTAAGSGVGIAAIQIARLVGARVVTTASTEAKRQRGIALGAEAAVDYTQPGWPEEVVRATGGGADVCLDSVSGQVLAECVEAMARGGRIVNCGATAGPTELSLEALRTRRVTFIPSFMGSNSYLHHVLRLVEAGRLSPVVHRVFPFEEVQEAHREMMGRENFGKIVLVW